MTGLTRFDSLLKNQDNNCSILFIPTWREWLLNERDFLDSEYYKKYKSMLQNKTLHQLLTDYDVELKFFPHYRMQPFINNFEVKHEKIKVLRLGEKTVQELLLESSLMITDYSSVSFDFNYMAKPVIFYHFDPDSFFRKGILRPIEETFIGDICYSEDELISTVKEYVKNNFSEKASAADKKHLIFSQMDKNNCQRVYNKVKEV
ncbi:CDP-glycerol glycerophosphotransferase family protein [Halobacillus andaensis]|uniref:CDP-glycerol glycerophosphotransferase family protein n=1 Tax=Halobacillus andaensis TaxID=1176239 RepID=UPI003D75A7F3